MGDTGVTGLEKRKLRIGIIPLTDCAVIAVAKEQGFFATYGLDVEISREPSWASIRDKLMTGALDGAHLLGPIPIAATLGLGAPPFPVIAALTLGLNGNAITVSETLFQEMVEADPSFPRMPRPWTARALAAVVRARKEGRKPILTFATVFPFSAHNYELRYWLAEAGIHPDRDVRIIVVPPPQMVRELAAGTIDGYCVGEPWNQVAVLSGLGRVVITGYELWNNAPEKVFGVARAWAEAHPNTLLALLRALLEAAQWLDDPHNRSAAADLLAAKNYVAVPPATIRSSLLGPYRYDWHGSEVTLPDFNVFHRYAANFPWVSHGVWWLCQMYRWGQLADPYDITAVAQAVYRPDIFRRAASALKIVAPGQDTKTEGSHRSAWQLGDLALGADAFFDRRRFDPATPIAYLESFAIHSLRLSLDQLRNAVTHPPHELMPGTLDRR